MKHKGMMNRKTSRPSTSHGRPDRHRKRGSGTPRNDTGFDNDDEYSFHQDGQNQKRQQSKNRHKPGYFSALETRRNDFPSENHHSLGAPPALKSQYSSGQPKGNGRSSRVFSVEGAQRDRNNSKAMSPLGTAAHISGQTVGVRTRVQKSKRNSFLREAQEWQGETAVMRDPIPRKVKNLDPKSKSPSGLSKTIIQKTKETISGWLGGGSKRSSQHTQTPNKRARRTDRLDSLASTTPRPASPEESPSAREQRKRQRQDRKPPPKEAVIDLVNSDDDTEDESSPTKPQQASKQKSPPTQQTFTDDVKERNSKQEPAKQKKNGDIYEFIHEVAGSAERKIPKTPSDTENHSPTKHGLRDDISSDDALEEDGGYETQEEQNADDGKLSQQRKLENRTGSDNLAGNTSTDGESGNQTEEGDSDDCGFLSKDGPVRKSKSTPLLQRAQNAAKTRENRDLEAMNNPQQLGKKSRKQMLVERKPIPPGQEAISILEDDDEEDENDGTHANSRSPYFEKDDDRKELRHPGMLQQRDSDMNLYPPASSALPPDLAVGDGANVDVLMAKFDTNTMQFRDESEGASASLKPGRALDDNDAFWNDCSTQPKKSKNSSPYNGDDSLILREMAEGLGGDPVKTYEDDTPTRKFARELHTASLCLTKHNNSTGAKKRKAGTKIVPGAASRAETKNNDNSQSTTSSQESRFFNDMSNVRRSAGRTPGNRFSARLSSEEKSLEMAKKMQDQEYMLAESKRRVRTRAITGKIPKKKRATNAEEPIVLSSDSEEEQDPLQDQDQEYDLFRIAFGKKVFDNACQLTFSPRCREITLEYQKSGRQTRNSNNYAKEYIRFILNEETLKAFKFYKKASDDNDPLDESDDDDNCEPPADFSFVAIQATPGPSNNLNKYPNKYQPDKKDAPIKNRYIVLEFRTDHDFDHFQDEMKQHLAEILPPGEITKGESHLFAEVLMKNSQKMARSRKAMETQSAFIRGRNSDATLLVFPFAGDPAQIDAAADGLQEASGKLKTNRGYISDESDEESDEQETREAASLSSAIGDVTDSSDGAVQKVKVRQHYVTLRIEDYERLQPEEWLNDSLVDFWMQWISRKEDKNSTNLHFFTSHFYSALARDGVEAVTSWTAKKNINIFEKKFIFIPINKDLHWSQCVVVNPGCIMNAYEYDIDKKAKLDVPCLIFMDSLRMHRKSTIRKQIENWLNSEYMRIHPDVKIENPFSRSRFELFTPKVPMQNNTWDCGVFVCRYALAIFKLRNRCFKFRDVHGNTPFSRIVTGGAEFDFNMDDIVRFRGEFQKLIENLSDVYGKWKRGGENPNRTNESEKKSSDEEVNSRTQKVEKETSTDEDERKEEANIDDELTGSPVAESMDLVEDNEANKDDELTGSPVAESMDLVEDNEANKDDELTGSPVAESMDLVESNESASLAAMEEEGMEDCVVDL